MFGLTKREQRWKAEQEALKTMTQFAATLVKSKADVEIAEAKNNKELQELRAEVAALKAVILAEGAKKDD